MVPAMIASLLILYWNWRESQPKPGESRTSPLLAKPPSASHNGEAERNLTMTIGEAASQFMPALDCEARKDAQSADTTSR